MSQDASIALQAGGTAILSLGREDVEVLRPGVISPGREKARGTGESAGASDEALVARARAGHRDAFEVLVARYQDRVYTIINSIVRDPEDALDLAQETFVKAYQGLERFRGGASFYTWLYRIAVNTAKDLLRKRNSRPSVSLEDEQLQDIGFEPAATGRESDPAGAAEARELCDVVRAAVAMLPEKLRAAIVLHDIEGLSQQEVAAILQCPLGTAKSHVFRGRARLRTLLGRYVEDKD